VRRLVVMKKIHKSILELIGKTPLVEIRKYNKKRSLYGEILVKVESFNPGGSGKDRIAINMIQEAELAGIVGPGSTIIEPTSGNTGIGLAMVCASKGYKSIFTMPETMSIERRKILMAYGAEIVLTKGVDGMSGAVQKAKELSKEIPGSFIPDQFSNQANPDIHLRTTGPEIWEDTEGEVEIFVAGIGTGGTITGVGNFLKNQNPLIKIIGVEPAASPLLSQGKYGPHPIQGIGANFIPETLDREVYDQIIAVEGEDAKETAQALAHEEGILVGISSGAALWAATEVAKLKENKGKKIVVLLPDTGERYLSI
jgi:cysteine synthase A